MFTVELFTLMPQFDIILSISLLAETYVWEPLVPSRDQFLSSQRSLFSSKRLRNYPWNKEHNSLSYGWNLIARFGRNPLLNVSLTWVLVFISFCVRETISEDPIKLTIDHPSIKNRETADKKHHNSIIKNHNKMTNSLFPLIWLWKWSKNCVGFTVVWWIRDVWFDDNFRYYQTN